MNITSILENALSFWKAFFISNKYHISHFFSANQCGSHSANFINRCYLFWYGIGIPLRNNFKILKMMNQYEVPSYLQDALPEMKEVLVKEGVSSNLFDPYKSVQCLTDFTLKVHISTILKC